MYSFIVYFREWNNMMNNYKYSKVIHCNQCKKGYRGKKKRTKNFYLCTTRNKKGKSVCDAPYIDEEFLDFVIIRNGGEIKKVSVSKDEILFEYENGEICKINDYVFMIKDTSGGNN